MKVETSEVIIYSLLIKKLSSKFWIMKVETREVAIYGWLIKKVELKFHRRRRMSIIEQLRCEIYLWEDSLER